MGGFVFYDAGTGVITYNLFLYLLQQARSKAIRIFKMYQFVGVSEGSERHTSASGRSINSYQSERSW